VLSLSIVFVLLVGLGLIVMCLSLRLLGSATLLIVIAVMVGIVIRPQEIVYVTVVALGQIVK